MEAESGCHWILYVTAHILEVIHMTNSTKDRVLYTPEHLAKLGEEASRPNSILSVEDRLSLLSDAMTLASSGHALTSGALTFIDRLRSEPDCKNFCIFFIRDFGTKQFFIFRSCMASYK